jgi:hypothetical protein
MVVNKGDKLFATQRVFNLIKPVKVVEQPVVVVPPPQPVVEQTPPVVEAPKELDPEEVEKQKAIEEEELRKKKELEAEEKQKEREEELKKDDRMRKFFLLNEEEKDELSCDEVFSLYLRDLCKRVNSEYYKTALRFVLLYRECLNEYGWLKRRDHYYKAGILDQDEVLNKLK